MILILAYAIFHSITLGFLLNAYVRQFCGFEISYRRMLSLGPTIFLLQICNLYLHVTIIQFIPSSFVILALLLGQLLAQFIMQATIFHYFIIDAQNNRLDLIASTVLSIVILFANLLILSVGINFVEETLHGINELLGLF